MTFEAGYNADMEFMVGTVAMGQMDQKEFGAYLKRLRLEAGFRSAAKFSKAVGVSSNAINDLERGLRRPLPETVEKITTALNEATKFRPDIPRVDYKTLLQLSGNIVPGDESSRAMLTPFTVEVMGICETVPVEGRETILRLLKDAAAIFAISRGMQPPAQQQSPRLGPAHSWIVDTVTSMTDPEAEDLQMQMMKKLDPHQKRLGLPDIQVSRAKSVEP